MLWTKKDKQSKQTSKALGNYWEEFAENYLIEKGLSPIEKNFFYRQGEIDLIMKHKSCIVFVEVKYRKNNQFGGAISAISQSKKQKIVKTASFFLQQQRLNEYNTECRFDVIAIEGDKDQQTVTWLQNAFN